MIAAMLIALAAASADADVCAVEAQCRYVENVTVQNRDGTPVNIPINQKMPWVPQGNLLLIPGDWIVIKLIEKDGALSPQFVAAGHDGKPQVPSEGEILFLIHDYDHGSLMMKVHSRYDVALEYAALMVTPRGPERTSVCTLQPNLPVYESWTNPIRQFAFWSFRKATDASCKIVEFPKKK